MEKRLLFLDLDGTLLNDEKQITQGNRTALERTLQWGHGVIIATGRPLKSALAQARRLGLDQPGCYTIAYNGAMVYDWSKKDTVFAQTLNIPAVVRVFDRANGQNLHIQTYDREDVLVEPRWEDEALERYCRMVSMTYRVIGDIRRDLPEAPVKCLAIDYQGRENLEAMAAWIRAEEPDLNCFFSNPHFLEIVPKGMDKGQAVAMLCRMLGVELCNAVAAGDAANDLAMLKMAGIGVAMANGSDEVKAAADYITQRDNNHDGIAEVADRFFWEQAD